MKGLKIEKPKTRIQEESIDGYTGRYCITPLERGYGITLGNALRRILLSSLPGVAIVNVKIDGVQHEFSTIEGVMEDTMTIVLNLKKIVLASTLDQVDANFESTMELHCGAGLVTAADIEHNSDIKIINPDQVIANVAEGGELYMYFTVRCGVGYVPAAKNKKYDNSVGTIAIDSLYTPIINVKYDVEKTRVDDSADYDKLIIEVKTNGSITARESLAIASKIMIDHLNVVVEMSEKAKSTDFMVETEDDSSNKRLEKMTIEELDLSVRSYNCLKRAGINTVSELTHKSEEDMMKVRNLGRKSLKEVKEKLESLGLGLNKD